jgi:hypothetical protein
MFVHAAANLAVHASLPPLPQYQNHCVACRVQAPIWSTCGSSTFSTVVKPDPSVCCPLDTTCRKYNDFFWQCMPSDGYEPKPEVTTYAGSCTGKKVRSCLATNCQLGI